LYLWEYVAATESRTHRNSATTFSGKPPHDKREVLCTFQANASLSNRIPPLRSF
jgi:hypothetical protein